MSASAQEPFLRRQAREWQPKRALSQRLGAPSLDAEPLLCVPRFLNAWCELTVEDLSGRCPQTRVGLPNTDPEGKGTDSSCSTWTPSSPHFTSWWTTSATPARKKSGFPDPMRRSALARVMHPRYLLPMEPLQQRAGLLPLRNGLLARRFPYPARPLAVQPVGALPGEAHRGGGLASGDNDGGSELPLPSPGQLGDARPGRAKRRGEGWLAGYADIGWSNSLGWYEGFRLLVATDPTGVITGFGFCAASATDQQVALRPSSLCGIDRTPDFRAWDRPSPRDPTWPTQGLRGRRKP
jgi:hypothetical protein